MAAFYPDLVCRLVCQLSGTQQHRTTPIQLWNRASEHQTTPIQLWNRASEHQVDLFAFLGLGRALDEEPPGRQVRDDAVVHFALGAVLTPDSVLLSLEPAVLGGHEGAIGVRGIGLNRKFP